MSTAKLQFVFGPYWMAFTVILLIAIGAVIPLSLYEPRGAPISEFGELLDDPPTIYATAASQEPDKALVEAWTLAREKSSQVRLSINEVPVVITPEMNLDEVFTLYWDKIPVVETNGTK